MGKCCFLFIKKFLFSDVIFGWLTVWVGREIDVFHLVTSMGQRKNSESPWGIKPQTFGFHALMHLKVLGSVPHGTHNFSLSHACDKTKNIFLYLSTELKTCHLSYSIYKIYLSMSMLFFFIKPEQISKFLVSLLLILGGYFYWYFWWVMDWLKCHAPHGILPG